ncbi:DUF411 domain-containing protein [Chromobacterium violaceum]|uniref:DUF411 domain-containing protein n=1 Tax=Chromobacterium violaceum TaxID=536 RepID=UPI0009DB30A3|nr:DUF411 domain-containing protein [Chromobacterium violaceum]OQS20239.1 CopG family transcriptional regulator [Chromobacterium violaceum]
MPTLRHTLIAVSFAALSASALAATPLTVYKSPSCGCCEAYIAYLKQNGFAVSAVNRDDMPEIKRQLGVTPGMGSCHTAKVGKYTIEGHVPVAAIRQLLASKSQLAGIAVPGMPLNSPGMGEVKPGTLTVYAMSKEQKTGVVFGRF